ncbi:MAG: MBL fold metallo-hydrolase [Deltaproteobacteria bacterium]|nr:MBL fold metallo-hydrolase [Deltaproteobacteria bacterium]MBW2136034.1 MBL fold metallo-hydrolase [Deltaproteobacteria bacterium]
MRTREPGKVCEGLWYLGRKESGVYLLEGSEGSMIISGGMSYIVPAILKQMEDFAIDRNRIKKLLILHSHFDHVGVVPFFKRSQPDLEIYASARAWEILSMPKAIETINAFSRDVAERMGMTGALGSHDLDWRDDIQGSVVRDGDRLDLDGVEVHIIETPGHSSCAISAYAPALKALFPSDSGGIPFDHIIVTSGNSNFTKYQESLERLKTLEVRYYCADHYGYVTGDEAATFISRSIECAREHRDLMEKTYLRTQDIDKAVDELMPAFYRDNPDYFLSPDIFRGVYRQMIKHIAQALEDKNPS